MHGAGVTTTRYGRISKPPQRYIPEDDGPYADDYSHDDNWDVLSSSESDDGIERDLESLVISSNPTKTRNASQISGGSQLSGGTQTSHSEDQSSSFESSFIDDRSSVTHSSTTRDSASYNSTSSSTS